MLLISGSLSSRAYKLVLNSYSLTDTSQHKDLERDKRQDTFKRAERIEHVFIEVTQHATVNSEDKVKINFNSTEHFLNQSNALNKPSHLNQDIAIYRAQHSLQ